jgi:hypothetical protein
VKGRDSGPAGISSADFAVVVVTTSVAVAELPAAKLTLPGFTEQVVFAGAREPNIESQDYFSVACEENASTRDITFICDLRSASAALLVT